MSQDELTFLAVLGFAWLFSIIAILFNREK